MTVWYLWVLSFAVGCVQAVDVPGRQMLMLDLVGEAELRRGSSLYAAVTGLAKIVGPGLAGIIIAASGEAPVFFTDAGSFLLVIAVLIWRARSSRRDLRPGARRRRGTAVPLAAGPPVACRWPPGWRF